MINPHETEVRIELPPHLEDYAVEIEDTEFAFAKVTKDGETYRVHYWPHNFEVQSISRWTADEFEPGEELSLSDFYTPDFSDAIRIEATR